MRLNLGCGRSRRNGWVNVDCTEVPGVTDLVVDLDGPALASALEPDCVEESSGVHVIEHLANPLQFMEALWAVTAPGGTATFEVPYGTSDDAWEDPTHRRPYFMQSWEYFGQPTYFRADYGYRGDWRVLQVALAVDADRWDGVPPDVVQAAVRSERNVVRAMHATLEAVKPIREPNRDLREPTPVRFVLV